MSERTMLQSKKAAALFYWILALGLLTTVLALPAQALAEQGTDPIITVADWLGEYYDNPDLVGYATMVRDDLNIDFDWATGAPSASLPADGFSVRWTRSTSFSAGNYRFFARSDDGVRVWVDGELIIDQWRDSAGDTYMAERRVSRGSHLLRVEYYENGGGAQIHVWWEKVDAESYPDWKGEYYDNRSLDGDPVWVRNDAPIDFDWGQGSPDADLPADGFSVRWTRKAYLEAETYRFHAIVDGAVCLWVGQQLVLESWQDGSVREITGEYTPARGEYWMKVEFFEGSGDAQIRVWWEKVYDPYDPAYPDWRGQYWSNQDLAGNPALVRNDGAVSFDWGTGAAAAGLPADKFSVRWERQVTFEQGVYTLYAQADNGIRVYLDGELLIDDWYTNSERVHSFALRLSGSYHLTVEYYDNGGDALVRFWWE